MAKGKQIRPVRIPMQPRPSRRFSTAPFVAYSRLMQGLRAQRTPAVNLAAFRGVVFHRLVSP